MRECRIMTCEKFAADEDLYDAVDKNKTVLRTKTSK